jgi:ribosomal protein S17E
MNPNSIAEEMLSLHPDSFSTDFKNNKDAIIKLIVLSPHLRNQVVGRITSIMKRKGQKLFIKREPREEEPRRPRR